jgi:hypothetical protein
VWGDALAALYNPQVGGWWHAPAACEIERHTLHFFARAMRWDVDAMTAHFTSGGSEANHTAVLAAIALHHGELAPRRAHEIRCPACAVRLAREPSLLSQDRADVGSRRRRRARRGRRLPMAYRSGRALRADRGRSRGRLAADDARGDGRHHRRRRDRPAARARRAWRDAKGCGSTSTPRGVGARSCHRR